MEHVYWNIRQCIEFFNIDRMRSKNYTGRVETMQHSTNVENIAPMEEQYAWEHLEEHGTSSKLQRAFR
jgi:hypothetical protein